MELKAEKRIEEGSRACRVLRQEQGMVPAVVYGGGGETVSVSVPLSELVVALRDRTAELTLKIGRKKENVRLGEVQRDTFGDTILHADFLRVS